MNDLDADRPAMAVAPVSATSAVLALSKAAWKLGTSLSKLDRDTKTTDTVLTSLVSEVQSLGNECDLVYAEVDEVISKSDIGVSWPSDVDGRLWNCLVAQVEETGGTMQELERLIKSWRGDEANVIGQAHRHRKLDTRRNQIARIRIKVVGHIDNFRILSLLINT